MLATGRGQQRTLAADRAAVGLVAQLLGTLAAQAHVAARQHGRVLQVRQADNALTRVLEAAWGKKKHQD